MPASSNITFAAAAAGSLDPLLMVVVTGTMIVALVASILGLAGWLWKR
jgi:hypothetical protein